MQIAIVFCRVKLTAMHRRQVLLHRRQTQALVRNHQNLIQNVRSQASILQIVKMKQRTRCPKPTGPASTLLGIPL